MPTSSVIMNSMPPVSAIELPPKASTCTQCAHYSSSPKQANRYIFKGILLGNNHCGAMSRAALLF